MKKGEIRKKIICFADLDGTLLDKETYEYKKSLRGIDMLKKKKIPIIICTSKTRAEIEHYRRIFKINDPFISENGGGIFIPKRYFNFRFNFNYETKKYKVIRLGEKYAKILKVAKELKKNYNIISFHELKVGEISKISGLKLWQAKLAKKREFDEPFILFNKKKKKKLMAYVKKFGLKIIEGGRFFHLVGRNDKGKAVKIILKLFRREYKRVRSIAFGDSKNDFPMLRVVDEGYLVKKPNGSYESDKFLKAEGVNGGGFSKVIEKILKNEALLNYSKKDKQED